MKKKLAAVILCLLCLCFLIPADVEAAAPSGIYGNGTGGIYIDINSSPYTDFANLSWGQYAYGTQGCAWFASARAKQLTGIGNTIWSGYSFWYNQYNLFGHGRGTEPRAKALACYENHVAVVEEVSGNSLLISEGGRTDIGSSHGYCAIDWKTAPTVGADYGTAGVFYGYVYLTASGPVDVGSDFYAYIIKNDTWNHLGLNGNAVQVVDQNNLSVGSDAWHFVRQSDGSYLIKNWYNKDVLTAEDYGAWEGTPVITADDAGGTNQRWYVYGPGNGSYSLRPAHAEMRLDVYNDESTPGTKVQLWSNNGSGAQKFYIHPVNWVGKSTVKVTAGTAGAATKITWSRARYSTGYNVKIYKISSSGAETLYKKVTGKTSHSYSVQLPAGKYKVYVESYNYDYKEKSSGKSFTVKAAQFSSVKLSKTSYTYTGKAIKPTVTAYVGGSKISSSNYTVTYKNNKNVGTATVTVKGKGIYSSCKKSVTFKIKPKAFTKVKLSKTSYTYNGSAKKPTVTVYVGEKKLASKYYSVSYKNNKNAGTATVTITGKSTYANYKSTKNFKIKPKAFTKVTLSAKQLTYNGKARKVTVKVYSGKTKLSSSYYTVSYKNNKNIGTATVTITGKDKYKNYKSSKTFKIIPAKQSISSLTTKGEKGMIYCTNKKDAKCDGYQVQGSTVSTFKTINIEGPVTSNSWYVQNLPSGKKYYIRVRSYKVVDGKKWYGPWSDVKSIKTK